MINRGDTPHVYDGLQSDYRRLLYNEFDDVLSVPVRLSAGYGTLKLGTAIAKNLSAGGNSGEYVPYNPTAIDAGGWQPGRAFCVMDISSGESTVDVTMDDSYKFAVGDDLIVNSDAISTVNCGAITTINRTSFTNKARLTFTDALTNGAPVSDNACISVEAGDNTNGYSDCVGVLLRATETGTGQDAKGGNGVVGVSNMVMYAGLTWNLDAAAQTDVSATSFGQFTVVK